MPRLNAAELITLGVNAVKALREKWKRGLEKNPFASEHLREFVNELLHEIIDKDELPK